MSQVPQGHVYGKQEPGETFFSRDYLGYMTVNINFFFFTIELHCIQNKVKGKIFGSVTLKKNKANRFFFGMCCHCWHVGLRGGVLLLK